MRKITKNKYNIGDIVFVCQYTYKNDTDGNNHLFVVINDDNEIIPLDYFGFIISSHIDKVKNKSKFKYNEPLLSSVTNGLKVDSIGDLLPPL